MPVYHYRQGIWNRWDVWQQAWIECIGRPQLANGVIVRVPEEWTGGAPIMRIADVQENVHTDVYA